LREAQQRYGLAGPDPSISGNYLFAHMMHRNEGQLHYWLSTEFAPAYSSEVDAMGGEGIIM